MIISEKELFKTSDALLEGLDYLNQDECAYNEKMVNVRYNERYNQNLIQLESCLKYGIDSGIENGGYIIHRICEECEIPHENIGFVVNEANIYADEEICDFYCQILESGIPVHIIPVSDESIYYQRLMEALEMDEDAETFDQCYNLQSYITESIIDTAKDNIMGGVSKVKNAVKGIADKAKSAITSGIRGISNKLASVRKALHSKISQLSSATGSAKALLKRQISKLRDTASSLKSELSKAKSAVGNKLSSASKQVRSQAAGVKSRVSSGVDSLRQRFA